jgi:hypothetical protein
VDGFWRQAALNSVSPIVAALLGGVVVGILVQRAQARRERQALRTNLSFEMMRTAYGFYFPLIEAVRSLAYTEHRQPRLGLSWGYRTRRLAAANIPDLRHRVVEEQLRVNFPNAEARWLWHGVVDMLTARYFRLTHAPRRFDDLVKRHSLHVTEKEIPENIRKLFLTIQEYRDEKTLDAELMRRFERMLDKAVEAVLESKIDPRSGAAILAAGQDLRN